MLNNVTIQGRLCADPELRTTQSGVSVCSFRVAWSEKIKENEQKLFLSCTAWRSTGEIVSKYFTKGKEIIVDGKLITRSWQDKNGNDRQTNELQVNNVHFCGPKDGANSGGGSASSGSGANTVTTDNFDQISGDDSELPF